MLEDLFFGLIERWSKLRGWLLTWRFRQVFGKDAGKEYHIIYYLKFVQDRTTIFVSQKPKIERPLYANATNLTSIHSCATTRAMGHLVYSFGGNVKVPPTIDSDVDTDEKMDISFISIGGLGNLKTCDLLEDVSHFLRFDKNSIMWGPSILATACDGVDCAFIIKTHPYSNPERTWLCCAGVGEWGTSGAAWLLARKWKDIRKWAKNRPFAIITKTHINSDESTQLVHRFLRYSDTAEFTKLT